MKLGKKVKKKVYLLSLAIIILLIVGVAYFLFIEGLIPSNELTDKQVKAELERIAELNSNLEKENIDLSEPWRLFGEYNGRELVEGYSCENCPEDIEYKLVYDNIISEEECEEIKGKTLYFSDNKFKGCEPVIK